MEASKFFWQASSRQGAEKNNERGDRNAGWGKANWRRGNKRRGVLR